ncbi:hypothetical protein MCEMSE15_02954 [Fimbriimonadaceae bacterium]
MERQFSDNEAEEILRLAAEKFAAAESRKQTSLREENLIDMAAELGVPAEYVTEAISEVGADRIAAPPRLTSDDKPQPVPGNRRRQQWIRTVPGELDNEARVQVIEYLNRHHDCHGKFWFTKEQTEWASSMDGSMTTCTLRSANGFVQIHLAEPSPQNKFNVRSSIVLLLFYVAAFYVCIFHLHPNSLSVPLVTFGMSVVSTQRAIEYDRLRNKQSSMVIDRLECIIRRESDLKTAIA